MTVRLLSNGNDLIERMRLLSAALCLVLLTSVSACQSNDAATQTPVPPKVDVPFAKHGTLDFLRGGEVFLTIDIEIADNDSTITRGLMQRSGLPDLSGMLFVFPDESPRSFWMANTPLPLDIMFADSEGTLVSITKYTTPLSQEQVLSEGAAQYVVEVPAGFSDTHGIVATDVVEWRRD